MAQSAGGRVRLEVEPGAAGSRLDRFLSVRLGVGRAEARRLLESGAVRVDGRARGLAHKGTALAPGSEVEVEDFTEPGARRAVPEPELELRLLAEGAGWLAVDKPSGVAVHPLRPDERGSVLNALISQHPEVHGVGEGGLRSGVVHRLDVDTSGVLLFGLEASTWERLRGAFRAHRVGKRYRALVHGPLAGAGEVDLELAVARHRPARVRVSGEGGRATHLSWRALETFDEAALVELRPRTGFLHQIRVTLEHLGHPVLGDPVYAAPEVCARAPRLMLHAAGVQIDEIRAESPDPGDFCALLEQLRESG